MKKLLALSIGVATFCPTLALADAQELITAINSGKATVDVRLRSERVSDDSAANDAHAETIRTVLSYKTADYRGFTAFLQFEDITNFGEERYNNTISGKTKYAAIADPALTQVNQAFIEAYGAKIFTDMQGHQANTYTGQFGFHGYNVVGLPIPPTPKIPTVKTPITFQKNTIPKNTHKRTFKR